MPLGLTIKNGQGIAVGKSILLFEREKVPQRPSNFFFFIQDAGKEYRTAVTEGSIVTLEGGQVMFKKKDSNAQSKVLILADRSVRVFRLEYVKDFDEAIMKRTELEEKYDAKK